MRIHSTLTLAALLVLLIAVALAVAGPVLAASRTVSIENFRYLPDPIRITIGDAIRWRNDDPVPHTATARNGSFDTALFLGGRTSDPIRFSTAGTFRYFCETHPEMTGTVIVAAATGTVPPTDTQAPGPERASVGALAILVALASIATGAWMLRVRSTRRHA